MKKAKRIISLSLSIILALSMASGCTQSGQKNEQKSEKTTEVQKPVKLTWFTNATTFKGSKIKNGYNDVACFQEIQKKTGIQVEFQQAAQTGQKAQITDVLNIMLASGNYPDILYWDFNGYPGGAAKLYDDKVVIKLNDLIDKNAPNFKKAMSDNPEVRKQSVLPDGTYIQFPKIEGDQKRLSYGGFSIRQDWLDKVGEKMPVTIDDWYRVAKAFKEKDPNGNGKADEVPFGDHVDMFLVKSFAAAWGVGSFDNFYLNPKTGKVAYGPLEPEFKEYITTLNKWVKEGIIEKEFPTLARNAFEANLYEGRYGVFEGMINKLDQYVNTMKAKDPNVNWVAAPWPKGPSGKSYTSHGAFAALISEGAAVTSQCKNPAAAVKFIDFMYSKEGSDILNWGVEGESYVMDNGKRKFAIKEGNNPDNLILSDYVKQYAVPSIGWTKYMSYDAWAQLDAPSDRAQNANKLWMEADKSMLMPSFVNDPAKIQRYADIMSEVKTLSSEMFIKFVTGAESLDKYDQYVQNLKKMGIEEALKITQDNYDSYKKR